MIHEKNINQLKSEVQYIQEVGTPSLCGNDQSRFSKPHIFWLPSFTGSDFLPSASFILQSVTMPPHVLISFLTLLLINKYLLSTIHLVLSPSHPI